MTPRKKNLPEEEGPAVMAGSSQVTEEEMAADDGIDWDAVLLADAAKGEAIEEAADDDNPFPDVWLEEVEEEVTQVRTFWDDVIRRMGGDPEKEYE